MSPTTSALRGATLLLLLGVVLGAVLRLGQVVPLQLHVANATHAHSHTLYWGWAGLALFALFFERLGVTGRRAWAALGGVAVVGVLTFGVFWVFGYARPGVVLSAASVVPFGAAVVLTWRALGRAPGQARGVDVPFLRAAVVFVAVSYAAALSRVVLKVLHVEDPLYAALAVHGFLAAFGAFFTLGVMGLQVSVLPRSRARGVVLAFVGVFPWGALQVVPGVEGTALGVFFRVCAVLMVVPAVAWLRLVFARGGTWLVRTTGVAWAASVVALALHAVGVFSSFALQRHAVVLVVHLQTLGLLTSAVLGLLEARHALPRPGLLLAHQGAVLVLLAGLGVATLWPGRAGLVLAAVGGVGVVVLELVVVARFWAVGAEVGASRPRQLEDLECW